MATFLIRHRRDPSPYAWIATRGYKTSVESAITRVINMLRTRIVANGKTIQRDSTLQQQLLNTQALWRESRTMQRYSDFEAMEVLEHEAVLPRNFIADFNALKREQYHISNNRLYYAGTHIPTKVLAVPKDKDQLSLHWTRLIFSIRLRSSDYCFWFLMRNEHDERTFVDAVMVGIGYMSDYRTRLVRKRSWERDPSIAQDYDYRIEFLTEQLRRLRTALKEKPSLIELNSQTITVSSVKNAVSDLNRKELAKTLVSEVKPCIDKSHEEHSLDTIPTLQSIINSWHSQ